MSRLFFAPPKKKTTTTCPRPCFTVVVDSFPPKNNVAHPDQRPPQIPVSRLDETGGGTGGWSSASNLDLAGVETPPTAPVSPAAASACEPCPSCPVCPAVSTPADAPAVRGGAAVAAAGLTCADFDMGQCRLESLAQTTPHIIECSEAGEGGSQEVRLFCFFFNGLRMHRLCSVCSVRKHV